MSGRRRTRRARRSRATRRCHRSRSRAPAAGSVSRADHRHGQRDGQPLRRRRPVPARRAEPRRRGHDRAVLDPWDTRGELNGTHVLTAVARDSVGNTATSSPVTVTVSNTGVSTVGLRAAYGLDEGSGDDGRRLLEQPQHGDARGRRRLVDERPIRRRRHVERDDERARPAGARDLLQDGVHARGVGAQAVDEGRRRRRRLMGRRPGRRRDDLGRPRLRPLPARDGLQLRELRRLGPDAHRRPVAARCGDVRRHHRALLRRRRRDRFCALRGQRRSRDTAGGSARTALLRQASSTAPSTTSASTTAHSRPARSRRTPHPGSSQTAPRPP